MISLLLFGTQTGMEK